MPHEIAYLAPVVSTPDHLPQVDRRAGISAAETYLAIKQTRRSVQELRRLAMSLLVTLAAIAWIVAKLMEIANA